MFDLQFYRVVTKMLEWTKDAPGLQIMNANQTYARKKWEKNALNGVSLDEVPLRDYVLDTYPRYFGLLVNFGAYITMINKISTDSTPLK